MDYGEADMSKHEPLVFGDPEAPLTVGVFVRWLEEVMIPHMEKENEQAKLIGDVWLMITGNGHPEDGIAFQHKEMWETSKRIDTSLRLGKLVWAGGLSLLGALAAVLAIGRTLGAW